jgi:protoheme IX farnesyltransferase
VTEPAPPGPWLRLTALAASGATLLAVISGAAQLGTAHRLLAALALPPLAALLVATWHSHRRLFWPVVAATALFGLAALVEVRGAHLALACLAFAGSLVVTALAHRPGFVEFGPWRDYVTLTKPRIMTLLLLTGFCGMVAGAHGLPRWDVALGAMVGLAMACGGASAINHVLDRDIDRLMGERTRRRPVAADRVPPAYALEFGLALSAASFALLASTVNLLTAALALVGNLFYVLVYTRWLKRSTPQNIVIGGAAGAVPPLVGWAAVTGGLDGMAIYLFAIVFFWTPPHFWALSLLMKGEYERVGVPMLPVVRGEKETRRQILLYSVLLWAVTQLPFCAGGLGAIYLVSSLVLGALFIGGAWLLTKRADRRTALRLYLFSLAYLALLFGTMVADVKL